MRLTPAKPMLHGWQVYAYNSMPKDSHVALLSGVSQRLCSSHLPKVATLPTGKASTCIWLSWLWQGGHLFVCARSVQPPGSSDIWLRDLATGVHICMSCVTALLTAVAPLWGHPGAEDAGQCALPADTNRWRPQ